MLTEQHIHSPGEQKMSRKMIKDNLWRFDTFTPHVGNVTGSGGQFIFPGSADRCAATYKEMDTPALNNESRQLSAAGRLLLSQYDAIV